MHKKLELAANAAIIIVAILLGVVLVRNYLLPQPKAQQEGAPSSIARGTRLSLTGVDWTASRKTVVLALSTRCHFCTESAPFYQRLARENTKIGNARIVALFPQPVSDGQKYLSDLGVTVDSVLQTSFDKIGVVGTPTIILADEAGAVIDSWRGKLTTDKETEVLNRLR